MTRCSVKGCGLRKNEDHPKLSFHSLPRNEAMKNKWLEIIGQENLKLCVKRNYICSLHFEESCFNRTLNLIRLRDNALPSRFLLPGDTRNNTILSDNSNIQNLSQSPVKLEIPKIEPDPLSLDTEESQPSASNDLADIVTTPNYCQKLKSNMSSYYMMENTNLIEKIRKLEYACKNKRKQTKRLFETVRRRNKTLAFLKGIVKDLKVKTKKKDLITQKTYCIEDISPPQTTNRIKDISPLQNTDRIEDISPVENTDRIEDINTKTKEEFSKGPPPNTGRKVHLPKIMIKVGDVRKCCRLCLTKIGEMKPLFGASLDQMVMDISSLKMSIGDGFPQQACISCIRRLSAAYNFRTMILDSHDTISYTLSAKNQGKTQIFEEGFDEDDDDDDENPRRAVVTLDSISNLITIDSAAVAKIKNKSNVTRQEILNEWGETNTSDIENDGENEHINFTEEIEEVDNIEEKLKHTMCIKSDDDSWSAASTGLRSDFESLETPDEGIESLKCALKENLQLHQEKCPKCGLMIGKHNFSRHMAAHDNTGHYVCAVCGKIFADKNRIKKHERLHSLHETFPAANNLCPYCGKKFKWESSLSKHLRYHTGHNLCKCSVCNKSFSSRHYWKLHERSHIEKSFECSVCKRRFTQPSSMRKHVRTIHAENRPDKFQCDQCNQSFFDKDILIAHISKKHSTKCLFKCNSCDKSFYNMKLLKSHSKVHILERERTAGEEEFILRDDDHDYGKKMMRTLTVEYMCFKCEGKFATCDELKNHAENCTEASSNSNNSETSSKLQIVNICKLCHSVFTQTSDLLEHYNTEHNVLAVIDEKTGKKNITVFAELVLKNDATPPSEPKKKYFIRTEMN